jgi:Zn-dependent M28 family amino/carboxypeptidase
MLRLLLPLVLAASAAAEPVDLESPAVAAALQTIRPEAIRAHVGFLADDLLEGRGTGGRGHLLAAKYAAAQLEALGLRPAGTSGTYFQQVPLRQAVVKTEGSSVTIKVGGKVQALKHGVDCLVGADFLKTTSAVTAPVVFAGWGITAPERKRDDYAGLAVRGKIVALLMGAPASFSGTARAHYSSRLLKFKNAADHGAVGVLTLRTREAEGRFAWAALLRHAAFPSMRWVAPDGSVDGALPSLQGLALLGPKAGELLFEGAKPSLAEVFEAAKGDVLHGFELPATVSITTTTAHASVESPNVVGLLPGSDPALAHEYVVYTAHLDHLGVGAPIDGDSIYNGALDNASGVAGLLEVARAFATLPQRPRRSLLFLGVTAEEKGLLGSDYFAHYPTVPIADIVADVNMDGLLMLYPLKDVVGIGAETSSLGRTLERAAGRLGLAVSPDPTPEEVFFIRSDQYSFVKQGIPSIFTDAGFGSAAPGVDGGALVQRWMTTRYHSPKDDFAQPMDFEAGAKLAQVQFLIGLMVANETERPAWVPGDFFGETFGRRH